VHRAYVAAGSEVVTTNTFGANALKLDGAATVDAVFEAAIRCAKRSGARYVAADIGPSGALLEPMGTYAFDDAYELFAEQARAAAAHGADLFIIETMTDLLEMKAALLACKEQTDLPIFATMTFEENGRTPPPSWARAPKWPPSRFRPWAPTWWASTARWGRHSSRPWCARCSPTRPAPSCCKPTPGCPLW
jgi:S-methylmethionine-dependent homocysteine/selenocysteine methylase